MNSLLWALGDVAILIALGYGLYRSGRFGANFWSQLDGLTYYIFFPALLFLSSAQADFELATVAWLWLALFFAYVSVTLLTIVTRQRSGLSNASFTSYLQGAIRPNTYVGVAVALALFAEQGQSAMALALAFSVPMVNVVSVAGFVHFLPATSTANSSSSITRRYLRPMLRNPLIWACASGLLWNLLDATLPVLLQRGMDVLAQAALPVGLLSVGAGLRFGVWWQQRNAILGSSLCKLMLMPAATWFCCWLLGVQGVWLLCAVLLTSLPTSASAYVLAGQMGGDQPLMAQIITVQTILAVVTIPLWQLALIT